MDSRINTFRYIKTGILLVLVIFIQFCKKEEVDNKVPSCSIVTPQNSIFILQGSTVVIEADAFDSDGNVDIVKFLLDKEEIGSANASPFKFNWATENVSLGNHEVSIRATDDDGETTTDKITVFVVDELLDPRIPVANLVADETDIKTGTNVRFTDLSSNNPTSWYWNFGDFENSELQNPDHVYKTSGIYNVTLTAGNDFGYHTVIKNEYIFVSENATLLVEFINVEGGTFQMGSDDGGAEEQPVHTVTVDGFRISEYEITNIQYCDFLNSINYNNNSWYLNYIELSDPACQIQFTGANYYPKTEMSSYPVVMVTWKGAEAYCRWQNGRLPTEAEWEFAARGGNLSNNYLYSGSDSLDLVSWHLYNSEGEIHKVGFKLPNELGIYDMSGNLWEWCSDYYSGDYYETSPENNPLGPGTGHTRVKRGGSWENGAYFHRVTCRYNENPERGYNTIGFRLLKE